MLRQDHALLELTAVGATAWRVSDARMPEDDGMRVVAFVDCAGGDAEVVWLRGSLAEPRRFPDLERALDAIADVVASFPEPNAHPPGESAALRENREVVA